MLQRYGITALDQIDAELASRAGSALENGVVLIFPELAFALDAEERRIVSQDNAAGEAKNISYNPQTAKLKGHCPRQRAS